MLCENKLIFDFELKSFLVAVKMNYPETLAIISASLSVIVAAVSIWKTGNGIIKRLVIIQNRLSSLKVLIISLQLRTNDVEKYLSISHGYHLRESSITMEQTIIDEYEHGDTGL